MFAWHSPLLSILPFYFRILSDHKSDHKFKQKNSKMSTIWHFFVFGLGSYQITKSTLSKINTKTQTLQFCHYCGVGYREWVMIVSKRQRSLSSCVASIFSDKGNKWSRTIISNRSDSVPTYLPIIYC